jgi:hypothetical protein
MIAGMDFWFWLFMNLSAFVALTISAVAFFILWKAIGYKDILWFFCVPLLCICIRILTTLGDLEIINPLPGKELLVISYIFLALASVKLVLAIKRFIKNGNGK